MDGMTTVVVVHETASPSVRRLLALCDEHVAILKRASWGGVDELVGFSTVMDCEACELVPELTLPDRRTIQSRQPFRRYLHPLPAST
jgi:hypothetical protein